MESNRMINGVKIDELVDLLLKLRKTHQLVDINLDIPNNTLQVRGHKKEDPPSAEDITDFKPLLG